jgi:hypothetical protein
VQDFTFCEQHADGGGDSFGVLLTLHGVTPETPTDSFFLFQ